MSSLPAATPRLLFRAWQEGDLALARGLWGDPRVTALIDARGALDEAQVRARLAEQLELQRRHGVQYWPLFLLATGEHVGCCGLRPRDPARRVFELGFHLRHDFFGRGLAAEAARAVIDHAFGALQATALFAGHHPQNGASRRVLGQLGFVHTHDELYGPTGLLHPSYELPAPPR